MKCKAIDIHCNYNHGAPQDTKYAVERIGYGIYFALIGEENKQNILFINAERDFLAFKDGKM